MPASVWVALDDDTELLRLYPCPVRETLLTDLETVDICVGVCNPLHMVIGTVRGRGTGAGGWLGAADPSQHHICSLWMQLEA